MKSFNYYKYFKYPQIPFTLQSGTAGEGQQLFWMDKFFINFYTQLLCIFKVAGELAERLPAMAAVLIAPAVEM